LSLCPEKSAPPPVWQGARRDRLSRMMDILRFLGAVLAGVAAVIADVRPGAGALQHLVQPPGVVVDAGDGLFCAEGDPLGVGYAGQDQAALPALAAGQAGDSPVLHGRGNGRSE